MGHSNRSDTGVTPKKKATATERPTKAPPDLATFGGRLRAAYVGAGFTRNAFVNRIKSTNAHVMRLERGAIPGSDVLVRIANACRVNERWLAQGMEGAAAEFHEWLRSEAPRDLTAQETWLLASIVLPGPHPGTLFYNAVLTAWRMGAGPHQTVVRH